MESWETHVNGPIEDVQLKERLERKYVGLKLYDKDDENRILTCAKAYFKKMRGDNTYCIFAVMEGYDPIKMTWRSPTMNYGHFGILLRLFTTAFGIIIWKIKERMV